MNCWESAVSRTGQVGMALWEHIGKANEEGIGR